MNLKESKLLFDISYNFVCSYFIFVYIFLFEFSIWSFLLHIDRFCIQIFNNLHTVVVHFIVYVLLMLNMYDK